MPCTVSWGSAPGPPESSSCVALANLFVGCVFIAEGFWIRTFGVVLTAEYASIRGLRRRRVPWSEVQAVVRHRQLGSWLVQIIPEHGDRITLRAPSSFWGMGSADYEREYDRIGQWWLAHRGESWRPVRAEAPPVPNEG